MKFQYDINSMVENKKRLKIAFGTDHGGFALKTQLINALKQDGLIEIIDLGCFTNDSVDYPDYAAKVCQALQNQEVNFGVLVCTTGIGMSIAANKYFGIRAALCLNEDSASFSRKHNDANVLVLSGKYTNFNSAYKILNVFLQTQFTEEMRHCNRILKLEINHVGS